MILFICYFQTPLFLSVSFILHVLMSLINLENIGLHCLGFSLAKPRPFSLGEFTFPAVQVVPNCSAKPTEVPERKCVIMSFSLDLSESSCERLISMQIC